MAIANNKSITKAAKELYLTQPTLTRQMQNLEKEIGKQLFIRSNKRISLTESGQLLKRRAEEIVELSERTEAELANDNNDCGEINIAGGESHAIDIVALTAKELQEENNNIKFNIYSEDTQGVIERLEKGLIDFGILVEPADISNFEYIRLPKYDVWRILMRKDSHLANKEFVSLEDLENLPIITSRHSITNGIIANYERTSQKKLNIVATYNLIYNASIMVKVGMRYAMRLDKLINTTDSDLTFVPLKPTLNTTLVIAWKKNQALTNCCKKFLSKLIDNIKTVNS